MRHISGSLWGKNEEEKTHYFYYLDCAPRRLFRGLIVFCLNKPVNEHQSWDAGGSVCVSADLGVPADLGQTPGRTKTNLSVSAGLRVLIRGLDSLSAAPSQASGPL